MTSLSNIRDEKTDRRIIKTFTEEEIVLIYSLVDEKKGFTIKSTINHYLKAIKHSPGR